MPLPVDGVDGSFETKINTTGNMSGGVGVGWGEGGGGGGGGWGGEGGGAETVRRRDAEASGT